MKEKYLRPKFKRPHGNREWMEKYESYTLILCEMEQQWREEEWNGFRDKLIFGVKSRKTRKTFFFIIIKKKKRCVICSVTIIREWF